MRRTDTNRWWEEAAEEMVWEGAKLVDCAYKRGVTLTQEEADGLFRTKEFQRIFVKSRNEFFSELGRNPSRTKATVLGRLDMCATKLMESGAFDKAAGVLLQLAKVEGWVGGEGEVNVFAGLSQQELDQLRQQAHARRGPQPQVGAN